MLAGAGCAAAKVEVLALQSRICHKGGGLNTTEASRTFHWRTVIISIRRRMVVVTIVIIRIL